MFLIVNRKVPLKPAGKDGLVSATVVVCLTLSYW